nr:MAG TPA: hypothetical protein [Caudoviricetes sp.]
MAEKCCEIRDLTIRGSIRDDFLVRCDFRCKIREF